MQRGHLAERTVILVGRPQFLTRDRARRLVERAGGRMGTAREPDGALAVFGTRGTASLIRDGMLGQTVQRYRASGAEPVSEIALLRAIGLMDPLGNDARAYSVHDVARSARIGVQDVETLIIAGAIEPVEGSFTFADLRTARAVAGWLAEGVPLHELASHVATARRTGTALDPGAGVPDLDPTGQASLDLAVNAPTLHDAIARAEEADAHDLPRESTRWWHIAAGAAPRDATLRFNLGCALLRAGAAREAELQFEKAAHLDPSMADAWFNAAQAARMQARPDRALAHLDRAIDADPRWPEPLIQRMRNAVDTDAWNLLASLLQRLEAIELNGADANFAKQTRQLLHLVRGGETF
ncbi:MAG: repeat protein/Tetratricopeptide repeat protein [Rhodospirillales bacterium]|nr:repeat protein/Tetratricopeptide repeat protein [Rhodospirillales bacterium]